jgi:DNA-binding MarR family transcriptional regulator
MGKLREELKQRRPFRSLREEAILNIWRTGDILARRLDQVLKTRGLSNTQYNALRILRGAGDDGLPCSDVAGRMLTRDPDITRLLDRLAKRGLARRVRVRQDRRVILAKITSAGLNLLAELENPVAQLIDGSTAHLKENEIHTLIGILEGLRQE